MGLNNPLEDNWQLNMVLKGINRDKGMEQNRKLPITPTILLAIQKCLALDFPRDMVFWATCVLAFFGLLRKSNLLPTSAGTFDRDKLFTRADLHRTPSGLLLKLKWSKTIQHKERSLFIPLPIIHKHPLCPVMAIARLLLLNPSAEGLTPLLSYPTPTGSHLLTQSVFTTRLRSILSDLGLPQQHYSGHSFRRGGASWAFQSGLPGEVVQILGDWKSDAYKTYLHLDNTTKFHFMYQFCSNLPNST